MQFVIKKPLSIFFILLASHSNYFYGNYNSAGQLGYINTPSAKNSPEGNFSTSLLRSSPDRKLMVLASPFNWLDANIFYVDIGGLPYGNNGLYKQSYKDKGFE